jgi:uncharacterized protein
MSQENVEIVRRAIDVFNGGELDEAARFDWFDPAVEFHENPRLPEAGIYRGQEEIEGYFRRFLDSFEEYRFEIEEIFDAGDQVVAFNRQSGRGKGSGAEVEMRNAWVFALRGGKIVRITPYWDRAEALEAVGLREQADEPR